MRWQIIFRGRGRAAAPCRVIEPDNLAWARPCARVSSYQRLRPRIGHGRALGAVQHSILIAYWHMFTTAETYRDLGSDYYQRRDPQREIKRLVT